MSIRIEVLELLHETPLDSQDMSEVFYHVGGRSWPTFCREMYRMRSKGEIEIEHVSHEENYVRLTCP